MKSLMQGLGAVKDIIINNTQNNFVKSLMTIVLILRKQLIKFTFYKDYHEYGLN